MPDSYALAKSERCASAQQKPPLRRERLYDLAAAAPLILWYLFACAGFGIQIRLQLLNRPLPPRVALEICSEITIAVFLGLQIVLFVVRHLPVEKARGFVPRFVALIGSNLGLAFFALPHADVRTPVLLLGQAMLTSGILASIAVLGWLGRGFSIFPQARSLVTKGPYRFVRHPLYLAEQVGLTGVMLQFVQPWSALLWVCCLLAQIARMHFEERALSAAYPGYREYMQRTYRIVPGLY